MTDTTENTSTADIVRRLENPSCIADSEHHNVFESLQERARERIADSENSHLLNETNHPERLLYAHYHSDASERSPRYALVAESVAKLSGENMDDIEDIEELDTAETVTEQIRVHQRGYADWLLNNRKQFAHTFWEFFPALNEAGFLPDEHDWEEYVQSGSFFEDFLVTDLVKYRVAGGDLTTADRRVSFREVLRPELETAAPEITFILGRIAWEGFLDETNPVPFDDSAPTGEVRINRVHGYPYQTDIGVVIPLAHPSNKNPIRDSYAHYLKEGLENTRTASERTHNHENIAE